MTLTPPPGRDELDSTHLAALFGSLPRVTPPAALRDRLLAAFDERVQSAAGAGPVGSAPAGRLLELPALRLLRHVPGWLRPALLGAGAAAAVVMAVGLAGGLGGSGRDLEADGTFAPAVASSHPTRWVSLTDAPASPSAAFRFVDDPSLPLQLAAAGPPYGP